MRLNIFGNSFTEGFVVNKYGIAASLRDPKVFSQFYLDSWPTIAWSCGFDVAPETLYERCGR